MTGFGDLNLKFSMIQAISVFMSSLNFMLSKVEHENSFITSEPRLYVRKLRGFMVVEIHKSPE